MSSVLAFLGNNFHHIDKLYVAVFGSLYPYIKIKFKEYTGEGRLMRSDAYSLIDNYLSSKSPTRAKRLQAHLKTNDESSLVLNMDDNEEIADEFQGVKVWWASGKTVVSSPTHHEENRYYMLTFHRRHRDLILGSYVTHVLKEGKAIRVNNRQRKLYTNNGNNVVGPRWSHVPFEHPATFQTLAMDSENKREIVDDLKEFSKAKDFYARTGRAWKRGYLLYGPPGTGKSTMIAAMANLLNYHLYDIDLTVVKDNTELRKLLIETSSNSIIVIEDIDCSLDLTGQRSNEKDKGQEQKETTNGGKEKEAKPSQVTLSGLLNIIDGLWSASRGERLVVFTTNYVEKLDAALIRKGRMDRHIQLSYCNYESFKVLARNYVNLKSHRLFPTIRRLLRGANMVPAEVVEHLATKKPSEDAEICLKNLIQALEKEKAENGRLKAEEEKKEQGNHRLKRKQMTMAQDHPIKIKRRSRK